MVPGGITLLLRISRVSIIVVLIFTIYILVDTLNKEKTYSNSMEELKNSLLDDLDILMDVNSELKEENDKLIRMMQLKGSLGELSNKIPMEELEMLLEQIPYGDVFRVPYIKTAGFGKSPGIDGKYRPNHQGIDLIPLEFNWLITPLAEGFVEDFSINSTLGKNVTIQHNKYVKTVYAHNKTVYNRATTGMTVRSNDAIAYLGSTGISDGIHLHLELWILTSIGWIAINPTPYLINLVI
jgi:murein DD-endopeptidase MepM/ murein hydrolase activator NlpD